MVTRRKNADSTLANPIPPVSSAPMVASVFLNLAVSMPSLYSWFNIVCNQLLLLTVIYAANKLGTVIDDNSCLHHRSIEESFWGEVRIPGMLLSRDRETYHILLSPIWCILC
jgi:hypothetical protein